MFTHTISYIHLHCNLWGIEIEAPKNSNLVLLEQLQSNQFFKRSLDQFLSDFKSLVFCDQEQIIFYFSKFLENLKGWINFCFFLDQLTSNDPAERHPYHLGYTEVSYFIAKTHAYFMTFVTPWQPMSCYVMWSVHWNFASFT